MSFRDAFNLGGWGMYPILICGILTIGAASFYAIRAEKRYLPLVLSLGLMTFISGCLGFTTGMINSLIHLGQLTPDKHYYALIGIAESLYNMLFAFVFLMLTAIAMVIAAWRIARLMPDQGRVGQATAES